MMETRSVASMRFAKTGYIVMSIVFCVVGVLFIALPAKAAVVIGKTLGVANTEAFGVHSDLDFKQTIGQNRHTHSNADKVHHAGCPQQDGQAQRDQQSPLRLLWHRH